VRLAGAPVRRKPPGFRRHAGGARRVEQTAWQWASAGGFSGGPEEALFPSGSAALYRRSMLEEIGAFDSRFFLYCEDTDLGLRARWARMEVPVRSRGRGGASLFALGGGASPLKAYYVERNRLFVLVKNFPAGMLLAAPFATAARYAGTSWYLLKGAAAPPDSRRGDNRTEACCGTSCEPTPLYSRTCRACGGNGERSPPGAHHSGDFPPPGAPMPSAREGWRRYDPPPVPIRCW
jgi:hypothetical protein